MHFLYMVRPICTPPALRPREAAARTPGRRYTSVNTVPIRRNFGAKNQPARTPLPAATGPTNTHESILCGYGCGPGVGAAAVDALGVGWDRLEVPAGRSEGQTEGRRSTKQAYRENEAKRSRVRGPRAAAHLPKRPWHRPLGGGRGGARPPTQ